MLTCWESHDKIYQGNSHSYKIDKLSILLEMKLLTGW